MYYVVKVLFQCEADNESQARSKVFEALEDALPYTHPAIEARLGERFSFAVRESECVGSQPQFILGVEK